MPMPPAKSKVGACASTAKPVPRGPHTVTLSPARKWAMRSVPRPTTWKKSTRLWGVTRQMDNGRAQVISCPGMPFAPVGAFQGKGVKTALAGFPEGNIVRHRKLGTAWGHHGHLHDLS